MAKKRDKKNADRKPSHTDEVPLALPEEVTEVDLAGLSDSAIPTAAPESEIFDLDSAEANADALDVEIPTAASASSSNLFGGSKPASPDSNLMNLEPLVPLQPASGWFDSQADGAMPGAADGLEANLAGPPSGTIEGSDIFAGPVTSALPKSDVSDVIAATAYGRGKPATDAPMVKINTSRTSDIALNFERPPEDADLPLAEEAGDSLFDGEEEEIDSARHSRTPNLPSDTTDFGASPAGGVDASSILADLSEPGSLPGDSSAIRIEAPGMNATLRGDKYDGDGTEADLDMPESGDANDPNHWHSQSGSDLFADRTRTEFELFPDAGTVDPFADELAADQPSLSSAPSSIFSGDKIPSGNSSNAQSSGGSVPIANMESTDSVEFSDHPDMNAADSGSFHVLPAGAVDFNMSDDPHPERSMRMEIPEEEDEWVGGKTDPGPASGILARRKHIDPTDEMAPVPATPVKGKPVAEKKKDSSMEVNWVADSVEEDKGGGKQHRQDAGATPRERKTGESGGVNKRGLAGLALGLLLGVGVSAGAYFSGVLPNKEESKSVASTGSVSSEALAAAEKRAIDQTKVAADLKVEKETFAADLKTEKDKAAKFDKNLLAEKEKVTTAEKNLNSEKAKATTAEKALVVEKDKATVAEKNVIAEKEKTTTAEKILLAEKEKTVLIEKDLVAQKDKVADGVKLLDAAKETYKKNEATSLAEIVKRDVAIDKAKLDVRKRDDEIASLKDAGVVRQAAVDGLVKELQGAKLLPEKFDNAALLAAVKSTVSRATGPDLNKLIPADLSAVAGTGLTTGQILDLASRAIKSDAATKAATAEIAKLKTDRDVQMAALKEAFETSMKKVQDANTVELKKATDATTVATDKLKAEQAAKLKEASDKYALDLKKLDDATAEKVKAVEAEAQKLLAAKDVKVSGLEVAIATEKARTAEVERRLKAVGGATSLASQQLDWLAKQESSRSLGAGIAAYKAGRYDAAVKELDAAAKHDPNDALSWYFLGASRWAQGKPDDAKSAYKQGAEREVLRLVPARQIDDLISPIQGAARDALTAARP